jgi:AraC-like DNA-binding protein
MLATARAGVTGQGAGRKDNASGRRSMQKDAEAKGTGKMGRSQSVVMAADAEAAELSAAERRQWRSALALLGRARRPQDLLHAPASAAGRRPGQPRHVLYHHAAECHELAFAGEGRAQVVTRERVFTLASGGLLVLQPGVYHAEIPAEPEEAYCLYWCHCDRTRATFTQGRYLSGRLEVTGVRLQGHTDVESIVSAVSAELQARRPSYHRAAHHLLAYLALILARRLDRGAQRHRDSYAIAGDASKWRQIDRALTFCQENLRDDIKVPDVAKALGLSPGQLGRIVASHLGISLSQYLLDLRMAEARNLLAQRDLRICDVARAVGYAYPEHFTRAFTRAVGLSPRAYRRHLAGE